MFLSDFNEQQLARKCRDFFNKPKTFFTNSFYGRFWRDGKRQKSKDEGG